MKVGIFSPYWQTFGGGERYLLSVAEFFQDRRDDVSIFWKEDSDVEKIKRRFDIDLAKVKFVSDIFHGDSNIVSKLYQTAKFDLIFYLSDGSIPTLLSKNNILHFQMPFNLPNQKTLANKLKFKKINKIVCNSYFTKKHIDRTFGVRSIVIYPPVDVDKFSPGKKENVIVSVGRFFGPTNPKKHDILIKSFIQLVSNKAIHNWHLVLIGGVTKESGKEVERLTKMAKNYPVKIITDSSFEILQENYAKAKIYWHAAGFGEDLKTYPEKAEHFGITTVEAMAAGCTPVVFAGGGQIEVVQEGESGFFWETTEQLQQKTLRLIKNDKLRSEMSANAAARSQKFSKQRFFKELETLL